MNDFAQRILRKKQRTWATNQSLRGREWNRADGDTRWRVMPYASSTWFHTAALRRMPYQASLVGLDKKKHPNKVRMLLFWWPVRESELLCADNNCAKMEWGLPHTIASLLCKLAEFWSYRISNKKAPCVERCFFVGDPYERSKYLPRLYGAIQNVNVWRRNT